MAGVRSRQKRLTPLPSDLASLSVSIRSDNSFTPAASGLRCVTVMVLWMVLPEARFCCAWEILMFQPIHHYYTQPGCDYRT